MKAPNTAKDVRRRPLFRRAERVFSAGVLDLTTQKILRLPVCHVEGTRGAKIVEEGAFQGDAVGDPHYLLLLYGLYRAEGFLHPAAHPLWHLQTAGNRGHVEQTPGKRPRPRRQALKQRVEVRYPPFGLAFVDAQALLILRLSVERGIGSSSRLHRSR